MADKEKEPETVAKAEYEAVIEKARRLEAETVDKQKQLDRFKNINPDKYAALLEENELLKKEGAGADPAKWEKIVEDAVKKEREAFSGKIGEYENKTKTLEGEVNHFKVITPAQQKLAEKKILPEQMPLMGMLIERELILTAEGIRVKGADGKPLRSAINPAKEMDVDEWADGLVNKYPSAFASEAVPGGRVPGRAAPASNGGITLDKFKSMSIAERSALPRDQHTKLSAQMVGMQDKQRVQLKTN